MEEYFCVIGNSLSVSRQKGKPLPEVMCYNMEKPFKKWNNQCFPKDFPKGWKDKKCDKICQEYLNVPERGIFHFVLFLFSFISFVCSQFMGDKRHNRQWDSYVSYYEHSIMHFISLIELG